MTRRDEAGAPTALNAAWLKWQTEYTLQLLQAGDERGLPELHAVYTAALQHLRYDACRAIIEDLGELHRSDALIEHRIAYYRARLTMAEKSWAFVDNEEMLALAAEAGVDQPTEWEVHWVRAQQLNHAAQPLEAIDLLEASLRSLTDAGQRRSASGSMVISWLAYQYRVHDRGEATQVVRDYLDEAISISDEVGDPYSLNQALIENAHADFTAGGFDQALDQWERALDVVRSVGNTERIADGLNRVAQALIALGRYEEAREGLERRHASRLGPARHDRRPSRQGDVHPTPHGSVVP